MSKLVEIDSCEQCRYSFGMMKLDVLICAKTKHTLSLDNKIPVDCPLPNAPREGAPQKCPQDRCPKCGGLMIDITSGRQALYPQYVNDKTYACMVCHHREEGAHCADTHNCPTCGNAMKDITTPFEYERGIKTYSCGGCNFHRTKIL